MSLDCIVIGGGAAGLFCAVKLAQRGKKTAVIEHMDRCGRKLAITGKGRCNVTNNCDAQTVMNNIPRNPKFMFSALQGFGPADTMNFFEELGVALKTERGGRVFPCSDKAEDIVSALVKAAEKAGVSTVYDRAEELIIRDGTVKGVKCTHAEYYAPNVVVATGGRSYPKTGSTGDGYKFAQQASHSVTPIMASLCPMVTKEHEECAGAMGLSLKNCILSLYEQGKKKPVYSELGEMLFTHFGLSGPLVLSASAHMGDTNKKNYLVRIDLKPALSEKQLDQRILRDFSSFENREFQNSLVKLLPAKLIPVIVGRSGIAGDKRVNQITKNERLELVRCIKGLEYNILRLRPVDEAIITRGGVRVGEIDPGTMASKLCKGLYFIGEVLDVDAYTGGFNLQIAFSTANSCAVNMA